MEIIRYDDEGKVDDVAISGDLLFRLEQMDDGFWWLAVSRGDKQVVFDIMSESAIDVHLREDDLGCIDDTARRR